MTPAIVAGGMVALVAAVVLGFGLSLCAMYAPNQAFLVDVPLVISDADDAAQAFSLVLPAGMYICTLAVEPPADMPPFEEVALQISLSVERHVAGSVERIAGETTTCPVSAETLAREVQRHRDNAAVVSRQPDMALPWPITNAATGIDLAVFGLGPCFAVPEDASRISIRFEIRNAGDLPESLRQARWHCRVERFIDAV
ncbi:MAG: hypothetical protein JXR94_11200 [Candidatus Hydrogenedentes bacterium]|nr:hypothetical protein [Candidatus Hydrogenedentota bacterium]